jgi:flagellar biosynthesis protein FliP
MDALVGARGTHSTEMRAMRTDALAKPLVRSARFVPLFLLIVLSAGSGVFAQETRVDVPSTPVAPAATEAAPPSVLPQSIQLPDLSTKENFSSAMQIIILLTVLSLAPAILIMMTSFTRIIIVLSLLRQALGTQQLPPNQVLIGLAMFMTFLVMGPTWQRVNDEALRPYLNGEIPQLEARNRALVPVREFMIAQIRRAGNDQDVDLFAEFAREKKPEAWHEVNTTTLIPAFMLSELKTAFLLGFKVYLPFLVIDMVISIVLISMGMMMLPPVLISLPFKLLLFVLVDGWHLITRSLMSSFVT